MPIVVHSTARIAPSAANLAASVFEGCTGSPIPEAGLIGPVEDLDGDRRHLAEPQDRASAAARPQHGGHTPELPE
jgi:hypothetical protein